MHIVIEPGKAIDEPPHALVVGVKDVWAVAMDFDAGDLLGVAVAGDVRATCR